MENIAAKFEAHVSSVKKLMGFDREVLQIAIDGIRNLQERLQQQGFDNPKLNGSRTLEMLEGFRKNDTLRSRYETIFNQALVLLVSYFASTIHELFCASVMLSLDRDPNSLLLKEQLKISVRDLKDANFNLRDMTPDLLVQTKDISFQDMQSIARAFREHLEIQIDRDAKVNDVIVAQSCRHVIVHSGGIINDRLVRQISGANPRNFIRNFVVGEVIQVTEADVEMIAASMCAYIQDLEAKVTSKFNRAA